MRRVSDLLGRVALVLAVLSSVSGVCGVVHAADPPNVEEARSHFLRGVKFYKDADYRSALVEFQEAYRIAPNDRVLFNIGQTNEELGDFAGAVQAFREYLARGGDSLGKQRRVEVEKSLRRLESHVGFVRVVVNEPDADVVVEGERHLDIGKSPLDKPILLNGGRWTIIAKKTGFTQAEEKVTIAGGDKKEIALRLVNPNAVAVAPPPPPPPPPPQQTKSRTPVFIAGGLTIALAAGATVTGILTIGANKDLDTQLGTFPGNPNAIDSARSKTNTLSLVTDILAGTAIVGAVVTVVLLVSSGSSSEPKTTGVAQQISRGYVTF